MLSFIQYLAEAKTRPDAMERIASRALAGAQARVKQQDKLLSPLASMNRDSKLDPRNGYPTESTKYWYHPDTRNLVRVETERDHSGTVLSAPDTFGIAGEQLEKLKERWSAIGPTVGPSNAAIRNGWVRLDSSGNALSVQGTQAQSHKVIRDHYAATGGARPMYYVDHFVDGKMSSGMLEGAGEVQHYIDHSGTPPTSASWRGRD